LGRINRLFALRFALRFAQGIERQANRPGAPDAALPWREALKTATRPADIDDVGHGC
jgi:hypothetical protein